MNESKPPAPSALAVETAKEWIAYAGHRDVMATTEEFVEDLSTRLESAFAQVRAEERERCAKVCERLSVKWDGDETPRERLELGGMFADAVIGCAIAIREGGSNES